MTVYWADAALATASFLFGLLVTVMALRLLVAMMALRLVARNGRKTMTPGKCPGRHDPRCTCTGTCQSAGPGGAAVPCKCPVCSPSIGPVFSPLASFTSQAPVPRGSGAGMTGFAGQGEQDFEFAVGRVSGLRQWTLAGPDLRTDPHKADRNWAPSPLAGATGFGWPDGVLEAVCNNGYRHSPPTEKDPGTGARCGCGFWAYWDMTALAANRFAVTGRGLPVLGVIAGYGRVLIGERGFRSEKAKIIALAPAFSVQAEVSRPSRDLWDQGQWVTGSLVDPVPDLVQQQHAANNERAQVQQRAQQHADAWMAVIGIRLMDMYPGAQVFATAAGLLASVTIEGKP